MSEKVPKLKVGDFARVMQTPQMKQNGFANRIGRVSNVRTEGEFQSCILEGPEFPELDGAAPFCSDSLMKTHDEPFMKLVREKFATWQAERDE